jgi:hypothetical protein
MYRLQSYCEVDVGQRLYSFGGECGVKQLARHQFDLPEIGPQFRIIREANEIDSVPLIFVIVEQLRMPEQAGVDNASHLSGAPVPDAVS